MRTRITKPVLIRSSVAKRNASIINAERKRMNEVEKNGAVGVFLRNAFGVKGRFMYNGT